MLPFLFILRYLFCLIFVYLLIVTFLVLILHYPNQTESILICVYILDVESFLSFYFIFQNNFNLLYYMLTLWIVHILVELCMSFFFSSSSLNVCNDVILENFCFFSV